MKRKKRMDLHLSHGRMNNAPTLWIYRQSQVTVFSKINIVLYVLDKYILYTAQMPYTLALILHHLIHFSLWKLIWCSKYFAHAYLSPDRDKWMLYCGPTTRHILGNYTAKKGQKINFNPGVSCVALKISPQF